MATTIGRVEYIAGIDGKKLPAEARKLGAEAGAAGGKAFTDNFDKQFSRLGRELATDMRKNGDFAGISFTDAFEGSIRNKLAGINQEIADIFSDNEGIDNYAKGFDRAGEASESLRTKLRTLNEAGILNDQMFGRLTSDLNKWRHANRDAEESVVSLGDGVDDADVKMARFGRDIDRNTDHVNKHSSAWKNLSANTRQWTLIIGAIASVGDDIAVLGSTAGSSLAVLAGSLNAVAIAGGTAIFMFKGLSGDLKDLPKSVRPSAEAFQDIGKAFGKVQDEIQKSSIPQLQPAFESLSKTVLALSPALQVVAQTISGFVSNFAAGIAPGTAGFEKLTTVITNSAPVVAGFLTAALSLGDALGTIFVAAQPSMIAFSNGLVDLFGRFDAFLASAEGQTALTAFFDTLARVMPAILELLGAVGNALADLVTPESITLLVGFLEQTAAFAPVLGEILSVIGKLNIPGILITALNAIGDALVPILPSLGEFASVLSGSLIVLLVALGNSLAEITTYLIPLFPLFSQLVLAIIDGILPALPALTDAFINLILALAPLLPSLVELLVQILPPLITFILTLSAVMSNALVNALSLVDNVVNFLIHTWNFWIGILNTFGVLINGIGDFIANVFAGRWDAAWAGIGKTFENVWKGITQVAEDAINAIIDLVNGLLDVIGGFTGLFGAGFSGEIGQVKFASGGMVGGPTNALIGEAGREAVIPMDKPLSQIDPSVRGYAAMIRGEGGSGTEIGKQVNVAPGAIVIMGSPNPRLTGSAVVDALVANSI